MPDKSFIIKRGLWYSKPRKLLLTDEFIEFEDGIVGEGKPFRIQKNDIKEYRFGVVSIAHIVWRYQVFVRTYDEQELKIDFSTWFRINAKELGSNYIEILTNVFNLYFADIARDFLKKYDNGETIEICSVKINKDFVTIQSKGLLGTTGINIPWENLKTKSYKTYYAVYSSENAAGINKSYRFLDDYNTSVLRSVLNAIIDYRNGNK